MAVAAEGKKKSGRLGFFSRKSKKAEHAKAAKTPPRVVKTEPASPTVSEITGITDPKKVLADAKKDMLLPPLKEPDDATAILEVSTKGSSLPSQPAPALKKKKLKSSWFSRSKYFKNMCEWAFNVIDTDGSGSVDEKELYSGLLLIHLKLATYAGPAACKPVQREYVNEIFERMDADDSGCLDREEFREVMMVLCSNVFTRVMIQWSMTLMIVPFVAQYILNGVYWVYGEIVSLIQNLDEYSPFFDAVEVFIETKRDMLIEMTPMAVRNVFGTIGTYLAMIPDSVWNTVPLTLMSCVLSILAVPYLLFKMDDYFRNLAHAKIEDEEDTTKKNV